MQPESQQPSEEIVELASSESLGDAMAENPGELRIVDPYEPVKNDIEPVYDAKVEPSNELVENDLANDEV